MRYNIIGIFPIISNLVSFVSIEMDSGVHNPLVDFFFHENAS